MTSEQLDLIQSHYKPPFTYDPQGQMIFDSLSRLVLDVRGWGWIQHLHDSEAIQDSFGKWVAEVLTREIKAISITPTAPPSASPDGRLSSGLPLSSDPHKTASDAAACPSGHSLPSQAPSSAPSGDQAAS